MLYYGRKWPCVIVYSLSLSSTTAAIPHTPDQQRPHFLHMRKRETEGQQHLGIRGRPTYPLPFTRKRRDVAGPDGIDESIGIHSSLALSTVHFSKIKHQCRDGAPTHDRLLPPTSTLSSDRPRRTRRGKRVSSCALSYECTGSSCYHIWYHLSQGCLVELGALAKAGVGGDHLLRVLLGAGLLLAAVCMGWGGEFGVEYRGGGEWCMNGCVYVCTHARTRRGSRRRGARARRRP